jgi:hypothetical protein
MATFSQITKIYRAFVLLLVCMAIGAVGALILLFLSAFLFAGANGDAWVRWFFAGGGHRFITAALALAAIAFPFVQRAKLKLV